MKEKRHYSCKIKNQSITNRYGDKKKDVDKRVTSSKSHYFLDIPMVYTKEMGPLICDKSRSNKVSFVKDGDRIPVYVIK